MGRGRILGMLANLGLVGASLVATALVLDLVLAPWLLPRVPLKLQPELREPALRSLTQSSKRGAVPGGDWIALAGDSYAAGQGDWFRSVDQDGNPPFHSAHLIRDRTGRDVLSFGHSGAGSLRALVAEPLGQLAYLDRTLLYATEPPGDLLIYFFAGNDLTDNLEDLRRRFDPRFGRERLRDPASFGRFLEEDVLGASKSWRQAESFRWRENFFLTRTLRYALARRLGGGGEGEPAPDVAQTADDAGGAPKAERPAQRNRLWAGGEWVGLGRALRAPGVVLGEDEVDDAFHVFREAARFLAARLPETRLHVVHIAAPAAVYRHQGDRVLVFATYFRERDGLYPVDAIARRGAALCERAARFAREEGMGFVDTLPFLRQATREGPIHGPVDWRHLNRRGQEALADAAVHVLEAAGSGYGPCMPVQG